MGLDPEQRFRKGRKATWIGLVGNVLLTAFKAYAGAVAGSKAMVADSLHSASDIVASTVVLVGLRVAKRPADAQHPYGHGKAESITAKIIGLILMGAGFQIGYTSLRAALSGVVSPPGILALAAAVTSIVTKEGLYQYKIRVGRRLNSPAVVASAYEHRSDAMSSVAALVGIAGARLGVPWLDPVAGAVVSAFVIKMGWDIAVRAIDELMDKAVGADVLEQIRSVALTVVGVETVDDVVARTTGPYTLVDMKIHVDPSLSVGEGHDVATRVRAEIMRAVANVEGVMVHVEPCDHEAEHVDRPSAVTG